MSTARFASSVHSALLPGGGAVHLDAHGNILADLPRIRSVGIADLANVLSHRIVRIVGSTSHHVHFVGGGELRYVYNSRGELIELEAYNMKGSISPDLCVTFSATARPAGRTPS